MKTSLPTILITGGAGFIGSALCRHLLLGNHAKVVNIDKITYACNPESLRSIEASPNYHFYKLDINQKSDVLRVLDTHKPDAVFHLAAESHVDCSIENPLPFIESNYVGTYNLLESVLKYYRTCSPQKQQKFKFLHVSTDEVYGPANKGETFDENSPFRPSSPYSASKAGADHLVSAWHKTYGLPIVIAHCANNYGPFQHPEKFIPKVIDAALTQKQIPIYGSGNQERDWIHVSDQAHAFVLLYQHAIIGERYNISARDLHSNISVATDICNAVDQIRGLQSDEPTQRLISHTTDRLGHDERYAMATDKFRAQTGWKPVVRFGIGLESLIRNFA